jgi:chromosome segregation ATPase
MAAHEVMTREKSARSTADRLLSEEKVIRQVTE